MPLSIALIIMMAGALGSAVLVNHPPAPPQRMHPPREKRILATCSQLGVVLLDEFLGVDADAACIFFGLLPYTATAPMDTVLATAMDACFAGATTSAWVAGQCTAFGAVNPLSGTTQLRACSNLFRVACTSTPPPPVINGLTLTSVVTQVSTTTSFLFTTTTVVLPSTTSTTTTQPDLVTATSTDFTFTISTVISATTTTGTSTAVSTSVSSVPTATTTVTVTTTRLIPRTSTVITVSTVPVTETTTSTSTRAVPSITTLLSCPVTTASPVTTTTSLFFTSTQTSFVECPVTLTRTVQSTRTRQAVLTTTATVTAPPPCELTGTCPNACGLKSALLTCPFVKSDLLLVLTPADHTRIGCVCKQLGLQPAPLGADNFDAAGEMVGRCLGTRGAAWLGSWMGNAQQCAVFEASSVGGAGRVRQAPCEAALPVLCSN